jgi:hypothetical protein
MSLESNATVSLDDVDAAPATLVKTSSSGSANATFCDPDTGMD